MIKKIFIYLLLLIPSTFIIGNINFTFAGAPTINCVGLPGCEDTDLSNPSAPNIELNNGQKWIGNFIGEVIKYVSVVAVISLMISGIMYMTSGGEEEKVKKAKNWIIWSLVGVFLSISAWGIINMLNSIKIN